MPEQSNYRNNHKPFNRRNFLSQASAFLILLFGPRISARTISGATFVFVRGDDGLLYYKQSQPDGTWTDWVSMSPPSVGISEHAPALSVRPKGQLDLFVRGNDRALWWRTYDGQVWHDWQSLDGKLTSGPAAATIALNSSDPPV